MRQRYYFNSEILSNRLRYVLIEPLLTCFFCRKEIQTVPLQHENRYYCCYGQGVRATEIIARRQTNRATQSQGLRHRTNGRQGNRDATVRHRQGELGRRSC